MRCLIVLSSLAQILGLCAGVAHADDGAERLSLAEAEALAVRQNTALDVAASAIEGAEERVEATKAQRLPRLSIDVNAIFWNEEISFPLPNPQPPPDILDVTVRGRITSTASLTVAQPITPQIALQHLVALEQAGVSAARADRRNAELEVAYRAADGYLLVLLATAAGDIADQRATQLTTQLERARALVEGGILQPVDVMRLEAAQASAQQDVIRSRSQAALASSALAVILGLPAGRSVAVADTFPDEPGPPPVALADAVKMAFQSRPDLAALAHRTTQAERGASAAKAQLLPTLVALGQVQRNDGGGSFQTANSWFVGLNLSWDVWDWGQRRHTYKEAAFRAEQARLGARQLHDQVRVEVEALARDAVSAYETLAVARTGLKAAEEAFRIQTAQYEEGAATTTDLLNAQAEVTQARLGYSSARYAYFRALAALARATGQRPTAVMTTK